MYRYGLLWIKRAKILQRWKSVAYSSVQNVVRSRPMIFRETVWKSMRLIRRQEPLCGRSARRITMIMESICSGWIIQNLTMVSMIMTIIVTSLDVLLRSATFIRRCIPERFMMESRAKHLIRHSYIWYEADGQEVRSMRL